MKSKTVCMLSCMHDLYDDRIYWKEALSLKKAGYDVIHLGIADKEQDYVSEHGIRLISIKQKRYLKNTIADILFKRITFRPNIYNKLFNKAKAVKAQVYHFHDPQINRIGKRLKNIDQNTKVVYDIHDPYPQGIKYRHHNKYLLKLFRIILGTLIEHWQYLKAKHYDMLIATEENVANLYQSALPNNKVEIIYNYSQSLNAPKKTAKNIKYDAIYLGGISSFRGAWTILNACRIAKKRNLNLKILLIGSIKEPGLKEQIFDFINFHELETHCTYLTPVPYEEIGDYYSISACGLVPFNDNPVYHLLMPIKTFEYMEYGLPIISSNLGHTRNIINRYDCGINVTPENPEEIVSALMKYKTNNELYLKHSENGKLAFVENFRWEQMEQKLVMLYNNLLD